MDIGNYSMPKRKNWFQRLFKSEYHEPRKRTLYDFLTMYTEAYHEQRAMRGFIFEVTRNNCEDLSRLPSKRLLKRHSIYGYNCNGLAWYLLEKYSEGKITIHDDAQPK